MALAATGKVKYAAYQYPIPQGIRPWSVLLSSTGTSGVGTTDITIEFNPDQNEDFQPYVWIQSWKRRNSIAESTGGASLKRAGGNAWELHGVGAGGAGTALYPALTSNVVNAVEWYGSHQEWVYIGRIIKGTTGGIAIAYLNVDTSVNIWELTGIVSEHPIPVPDYWRF